MEKFNEKVDWELQDIASKLNAGVIATTARLNDSWRNELITLKLPSEVLNRLWLETAFFGSYLLLKRFGDTLEKEKAEYINKAFRNAFLMIVQTVVFKEEYRKDTDFSKYLTSKFDRTIEMYKNYNGIDVKQLFCDLVRDAFNTSKSSKIKFIDNTFGNRLKIKLAFIISALGGNKEFIEEHKNEVFFSAKNLIAFADSATKTFMSISEEEIRE